MISEEELKKCYTLANVCSREEGDRNAILNALVQGWYIEKAVGHICDAIDDNMNKFFSK